MSGASREHTGRTRDAERFFLRTLGELSLADGSGRPVKVGARKSLLLLACLASQTQPWSRERLAALFWGDRQDEQARGSLRKALSDIRRALGDDSLSVDGGGVGLRTGILETDLDRLRRLAASGTTDDPGALRSFYGGDFLAEVDDTLDLLEWVTGLRAEARELASRILNRVVDRLSSEGRLETAVAHARELLSLDPLSEANHRRLMRLYGDSGERSKAIAQFQSCRQLLQRELGVEPSAETRQLADEIMHQAGPAGAAEGAKERPAHPPASETARSSDAARTTAQTPAVSVVDPLSLPDKPSIAVLPFDNMSGDPGQEYFSDGITEDIITALSRLRWLFVIARNSTFTYKGQPVDIKQVAREMGVRYVLEGSVRKAGQRVRVSAQLIEAESGNHIWAERFDRELADIFDLQDELTEAISGSVHAELAGSERQIARKKTVTDLSAWESYQRGWWHFYRFGTDNMAEAKRFMQKATERSPEFARAYAGLAYIAYAEVFLGYTLNRAATLEQGLRYAEHALSLDSRDDASHFALGRICTLLGDGERAIAAHEKALALNPSSAASCAGLAHTLLWSGRPEEAITMFTRAMRFSPHDPVLWGMFHFRSFAHSMLGAYDTALRDAKAAVQVKSDEFWAYLALAWPYVATGKQDKARAAIDQACCLKPGLSLAYVKGQFPAAYEGFAKELLGTLRQAGLPDA